MTIYSKLNPVTGEYLGTHERQKGTTPVLPYYTDIQMTLEHKEGFAIIFDFENKKFVYIEDHRQTFDDSGKKIGGTPFWLEGDTYETRPRYMTIPGPLPTNAILEKPNRIFTTIELAEQVRTERDLRLYSTQWIMDRHNEQIAAGITPTLSPADYLSWLTYRQELRDLPNQSGFPWNGPEDENCPWPVQPNL